MFSHPSKPAHHSATLKPLVYLRTSGQGLLQNIQNYLDFALQNTDHLEASRGEVEVRGAISRLNILAGGATNSLPTLVALGLPSMTPAVLWIANALFEEEWMNLSIDNLIAKRNRDSKAILQILSQIDLHDWYNNLVSEFEPSTLPPELVFPPGHPLPSRVYRQHPLPDRQHFYYPVNAFHQLLLDERETQLIALLTELGASVIKIQDQSAQNAIPNPEALPSSTQKIAESFQGLRSFKYRGKPWSENLGIRSSQYPWLTHEPTWQQVVDGRLRHQCQAASWEIDLDLSYAITAQIKGIEGLSRQLDSIRSASFAALSQEILERHRIWVWFPLS